MSVTTEPPAAVLRFEALPPSPPSLSTIPWLVDTSHFANHIHHTPPLATLDAPGTPTRATLHAAVTIHHILISLQVHKATHENTQSGPNIWDGDALQIGIDACPLASAHLDTEEAIVTPFTGMLAFALTQTGPHAWAHLHGNPRMRGDRADLINTKLCTITRENNITHYLLALPWSDFQTAAGISPTLGLSIQLNDRIPGGEKRLTFGAGIGAQLQPAQFEALAIAAPPAECQFIHVATIKHWIGKVGDEAIKIVAARTNRKIRLIAGIHDVRTFRTEHTLPASDSLQRTAVIFNAAWLPRADDCFNLTVHVSDDLSAAPASGIGGPAPIQANHLPTTNPRNFFRIMKEEMQYLYGDLDLPLVFHRSLKDLTHVVEAALEAAIRANRGIEEQISYIANITARVAENITITHDPRYRHDTPWRLAHTYGWHTHLAREAALVFTATSTADKSRQPYRLTIPRNLDLDGRTKYPLIVWLHGKGDPNMLRFITQGGLSTEALTDTTNAFILEPWSRGNAWYRNAAGTDVLNAIDDAVITFPIDHRRIYLGGHSMGASGTLRVAALAPARFRALATASLPHINLVEPDALVHLRMPIALWHGAVDSLCPAATTENLAHRLREQGNRVHCDISPDIGHSLSGETQAALFQWLLSQ